MIVKALRELLPPPAEPVDGGNPDLWMQVQARLGSRLPPDYEDFIGTYGSGTIDGFLTVLNACSLDPTISLELRGNQILEAHRAMRRSLPEEFDWPLYPEPNGWLPWAVTSSGNVLFWQTEGAPDTWPVVVAEGEAPRVEIYQRTMTSFLEGILARRIACSTLGTHFPRNGGSVFAT